MEYMTVIATMLFHVVMALFEPERMKNVDAPVLRCAAEARQGGLQKGMQSSAPMVKNRLREVREPCQLARVCHARCMRPCVWLARTLARASSFRAPRACLAHVNQRCVTPCW